MAQVGYKGVYGNMTFPPYTYVEYPKYVVNKSGVRVVVQNAREELAIASEPDPESTAEVPPIYQERDQLAAKAADLQAEVADLKAQMAALLALQTKAPPPVPPAAPTKPVDMSSESMIPEPKGLGLKPVPKV